MADHRCANCAHYEPSLRQGRGRCLHPEVRVLWRDRLIKRKAHACLSLGYDFWEAAGQELHIMLGKILLDSNTISRSQLEAGLAVQRAEGFNRRIGEIWIALGYVDTQEIQTALRTQDDMLQIAGR